MAKDGEVAYPFQPYHCAEALILWARRLGQVASTMIEAVPGIGEIVSQERSG